VVRAPDDHRSAEAALQQADAPQDERAHDALPQLGLGHEHIAQLPRGNHERVDRLRRLCVDERGLARELGELAHERAWAVRDDRLVAPEHAVLADGDFAAHDDEHARADLAGGHQALARVIGPAFAEPPQPVDLGHVERREHLLVAGLDRRTSRRGHAWTSSA
jgi:hypothetical protein